MATRWQEGVCRQWRQAGSSPVEENTAAMACWAQRRLESQCTVSTSSSSQDPSDIALPGLQPLPITHSVSARTHTMHSVSQQHTPPAIPSNQHYHILWEDWILGKMKINNCDENVNISSLKGFNYVSFLHITNKNGCWVYTQSLRSKATDWRQAWEALRFPDTVGHHSVRLFLSSSVVHGG